MAVPGLEPGTPRFSDMLLCRSSSAHLQGKGIISAASAESGFHGHCGPFPDVTADGGARRPFRRLATSPPRTLLKEAVATSIPFAARVPPFCISRSGERSRTPWRSGSERLVRPRRRDRPLAQAHRGDLAHAHQKPTVRSGRRRCSSSRLTALFGNAPPEHASHFA
jgi:hypothetical protein